MAFTIKQNDTLPNLYFQLFQADKVTPLNVTGATIAIAVRGVSDGLLLFKSPCVLDDAANGLGYYDWAVADTATAGNFQYEFEITWASGDVQTVPVEGYFDLVIVDDIG